MANCPNCGSNHIQLIKETNVNWGRAVAGWALLGVVGGAVGAVTGEDRNIITCLDCGTSWKSSDLHKILQIIKNLIGINPNLTVEKDRLFVNQFMSEITSYMDAISEAEKQSEKMIKDSETKKNESLVKGFVFGCMTSGVILRSAASSFAGGILFLIILIPPIVGIGIGTLADRANQKSIEKEIENIKRKAVRMNIEAEENFKLKVKELADLYKNI